jgi:hypothetical protein
MSTQAQKHANAQNSRFSTGPRTEAGKQKAAQNSVKHYLTAKQLVIPGENPEEYTQLHQDLTQSWNPANAQESLLVEQIAQNAWRLMRVRRLEAATFDRLMPSIEQQQQQGRVIVVRAPKNHDNAMAAAFDKFNKAFDNLRRYTTPIERAYHNAIAELAKLQKQRKIQEIGSVSQKVQTATAEPRFLEATEPIQAPQTRLTEYDDTNPRNSGT